MQGQCVVGSGAVGAALAGWVLVTGCSADVAGMNSRPQQEAGGGQAGDGSAEPAVDDGSGEGTDADFGNTRGMAQAPPEPRDPSDGDDDAEQAGEVEICVQDSTEATLELRPIDIIFTIDTSASMGQEIAGVQQNINDNFARIIGDSGIDYRVILISDDDVCVAGALNPGGCGQSSPPIYQWVDYGIGSDDTWCAILDSYPLWSSFLRPEAFKVFVAITDDSPSCDGQFNASMVGATSFDTALLALDPAQFGTAAERNYVFHSLVALAENTPATDAYMPSDPIVTAECATAADTGEGYQHLSQMTEGLRFPVCEGANFDTVFSTIAEGIVDGAAVACSFDIPATGDGGQEIDRSTVEVAYVPGDRNATIKFDHVTQVADCATEAFFVEGDTVQLCPTACDAVKTDPSAQVQVLFGCDVCAGLDADCGTSPPPELPPVE